MLAIGCNYYYQPQLVYTFLSPIISLFCTFQLPIYYYNIKIKLHRCYNNISITRTVHNVGI